MVTGCIAGLLGIPLPDAAAGKRFLDTKAALLHHFSVRFKAGKIVAFAGWTALVMVLAVEGLLRLWGAEPKFAADWVYRPLVGHSGPISEIVNLAGVRNVYGDLGFRSDQLVTPQPDSSEYSLVILGDSMTESSYLEREATYAGVLGRLLQRRKPRIHTLASADYGTLDETLALHLLKDRLKPKQIVLQFLGLNDFVNNTLAFAGRNKSESDFSRPYGIPEGRRAQISAAFQLGELPVTYENRLRSWLLEHSRIFLTAYAYSTSRAWNEAVAHGAPEADCPVELGLFLKEPGKDWLEGIEVTGKILRELRREAGEVPVLGIYFPSNVELDEGLWARSIEPKLKHCYPGAEVDRFLGEKRFLQLAERAGIRAISLREAMWAAAPRDHTDEKLFVPGGHLSALGHEVVAREIARALP